MALFDKKSPAEKVIDLFDKLSDEDKEVVKSHFGKKAEDLEKAEDEREVDKVEEEKADSEEVKEDKAEDVKEESEEIGKDVDESEKEEDEAEANETDESKKEDEKGEIEKAEEDVDEAKDTRLEALLDEFNIYKEKVDKLFAKLEELEEPEKQVGLGRQKSVEEAEDDEDLTAYQYAKKYAKY